jgi:YD repeat-containing protein
MRWEIPNSPASYTQTNNGSPAAGFDQTFGYDNLDRLTAATQAATTTQYT